MDTAVRDSLEAQLSWLRERIFEGDNAACFIEREEILSKVQGEAANAPAAARYAFVFETLLSQVSCPVEKGDVFLGRIVEARWPEDRPSPGFVAGFGSEGHMTLDWPELLAKGLGRIAQEARDAAARLNDDEAGTFAESAARCCEAVKQYAGRYADAARAKAPSANGRDRANFIRAADALGRVPAGPATDFFSALQSIWIVHLITSCYVGSRDFAFGRMDQYLLPYYRWSVAGGSLDRDSAVALLAHFLMKANEITGTGTWNYQPKPTPCQASKQYLVLGGRAPDGSGEANELTELILEAAKLVRMPQPALLARVDPRTDAGFKSKVTAACIALRGQMSIANDAVITPALRRAGVAAADAHDYTMVGCHRADLPGRMDSVRMTTYYYHDAAHWLVSALHGGRHPVGGTPWVDGVAGAADISSLEEVWEQFRQVCTAELERAVGGAADRIARSNTLVHFRFESLLIRDCVQRGREACRGGARYMPQGHFVGGIATVANSIQSIKRLVFEEQRFTLAELMKIVDNDFAGHESLRQEIVKRLPKFGNDDEEADALARHAGDIVLDALDAAGAQEGETILTGFYSLDAHHQWGRELPATPDGRLRGEPISENQSPVYGTDTKGVTAVLTSVAKLPLRRTAMGTLNVKFGHQVQPAELKSLIDAYFEMGGQCIGFNFVGRDELLAARENPERYRSLCVRMYGFSEYFVALGPDEQQEIIDRTAFSAGTM